MLVTLWDVDWYYARGSIPNIDCMKMSSFYKQKGAQINFVQEEAHILMDFDVMYIFKASEKGKMPPRSIIDKENVFLVGEGFKFFKTFKLNKVIAGCRPDYLLYPEEEKNAYSNAHFINFYVNGQLIKKRQDFHSTRKYHKKTLVTDKDFWQHEEKEILFCLEVLKEEKNIAFLHPISLEKIINNTEIQQKFLDLHFSKGTLFKWRNDYGSEAKDSKPIIEFLTKLRQKTKSDLGFVPIKGRLVEEWDFDFCRCLEIIHNFKRAKLRCVIIAGNGGNTLLEYWTRYCHKLSYVEFITHHKTQTEGIFWYNILNNPSKWDNPNIDFLLSIIASGKYDNYSEFVFTQWGYETLNSNLINKQNI